MLGIIRLITATRSTDLLEDERIEFRMGLNVGNAAVGPALLGRLGDLCRLLAVEPSCEGLGLHGVGKFYGDYETTIALIINELDRFVPMAIEPLPHLDHLIGKICVAYSNNHD